MSNAKSEVILEKMENIVNEKIIIIIKLQFIVAVNHPHFFFCGKQCSFLL
jgi:hypothetical protein